MNNNFINKRPTCLSHLRIWGFLNLTWIKKWELNWKIVLDIWTWLGDIWIKLAEQNKKSSFIHLDPTYEESIRDMKVYFIHTIEQILKKNFDSIIDMVKRDLMLGEDQINLESEILKIRENTTIWNTFFNSLEKKVNKNITRIAWVAQEIPIKNWIIDKVIITCFLKNAHAIDLLMKEIYRVLNNNWELIIVDYNSNRELFHYLKKAWLKITNTWERFLCIKISKNEILKLIKVIQKTNLIEASIDDLSFSFNKIEISLNEDLKIIL